jgi:hypothetical protein
MTFPVPSPYTPTNVNIYTLAFDGAMAGMLTSVRAETSLAVGTYAYFTEVARAYAISWDEAWDSAAAIDEIQAGLCWQESMGFWGDGTRVPVQPTIGLPDPALNPASYTQIIDAMIVTITSQEDSFAADGITPLPWGGGSGGFVAGGDLAGTPTVQRVEGINTMPLNTADTSPTASGVWVGTGSELTYRQLTSDDIAPGLTVVLSGGGAGTFETGAVWTPGSTLSSAPACNAGGVTAATLNDTNSGSVSRLGSANPFAPPSPTYTESAQGASVGISLTMTKGGVTKTSNSITSTWTFRNYAGCDNDGTGSGATADGNNATLVGGVDTPGALIGQLGGGGVGTTFSLTPSGTQFGYYLCLTTASPHTFMSGGFPFPMTRVATAFSFTNQFSAVGSFDLYVSNALTIPYTVQVAS